MSTDVLDLLRFMIEKTKSGTIYWIFRPSLRGGSAFGLSGQFKFVCIDDDFFLFYYRIGRAPLGYELIKNTPGWLLACQLYHLIKAMD